MSMKTPVIRGTVVALALVASGIFGATAPAQTVSTFTGNTSEQWTTSSNWSPSGVPSGSSVWAQVASSTGAILRIFYASGSFSGPTNTAQVGAMSLMPALASPTGTFNIQNNGTATSGTMRFYGVNTTVDAVSSRFIIINSSTLANVQFTQANAGQVFELFTNGAIHVTAGTQLTLSPLIRNGTSTGQAITKTGNGILSFSGTANSSSSNNSDLSTYSGGFTLDGGLVQWASSGSASANPFGIGSLTLKSGTLRSTSTGSRSINSNVILDGTATFGSTATGFTGVITVNSSGGALSTTVASNSLVTIVAGGSTGWNQSTSGIGGITKAGAGLLRFTPLSTLTHSGSTVVQEGPLSVAGNLSSASVVSVLNGASLFGTGTIAGATSILAGGTLSPGNIGGAVGLFTFGSGGLTLGGQTLMEISGTTRGVDYDAIDLGGVLNYGGSLALQISGSLPLGDFPLFSNFTSQAGTFSSISLSGFYTGSLSETAGVWAGNIGGQDFRFTNATGVLSVVPEPSTWLLGACGAVAVAWRCRRSRRKQRRAA